MRIVAAVSAWLAFLVPSLALAANTIILRVNPDAYPPYSVSQQQLMADLAIALPSGWSADVSELAWLVMGREPGVVCGISGQATACVIVGVSTELDPFKVLAGGLPPYALSRNGLVAFTEAAMVATALAGECAVEGTALMAQRMRGDAYATFAAAQMGRLNTDLLASTAIARALSPAFTRMENATLGVLRQAQSRARSIPVSQRSAGSSPDPQGWLMHFKWRRPSTAAVVANASQQPPSGYVQWWGIEDLFVDPDAKAVWDLEATGRMVFLDDLDRVFGADRDWRRAEKRPAFRASADLYSEADALASAAAWPYATIISTQNEYASLVARTPGASVEVLLSQSGQVVTNSALLRGVLVDAKAAYQGRL